MQLPFLKKKKHCKLVSNIRIYYKTNDFLNWVSIGDMLSGMESMYGVTAITHQASNRGTVLWDSSQLLSDAGVCAETVIEIHTKSHKELIESAIIKHFGLDPTNANFRIKTDQWLSEEPMPNMILVFKK